MRRILIVLFVVLGLVTVQGWLRAAPPARIASQSAGKASAAAGKERHPGRKTARAAAVIVFFAPKACHGALEGVIRAFPLPFLDALRGGNFAAFAERSLGAEILQGHRFQDFKIRQVAQFSDKHLCQA